MRKSNKLYSSLIMAIFMIVGMLLPQGAWATDFISEIKVSVENGNSGSNAKSRLRNDGYTLVEADLNGGAGGSTDYVYIGYKTSTNAADAITGLLIVESSSDPKFDAHAFDNITNANVIYNGKNYYRCDNYKVNDDGRLDCDLNRHNSKGADIVLFYTKDGNTSNGGTPLTSITVVGNTTETGVTYTRHWQYGTAQNGTGNTDVYGNTNQGNGTAHYITYTTHTHAYTAAFNWATNGKSCTATTNCAGCGDTHSNLACTVTDAPKSGAAATCTVMGWTTYTAKVTSNGKDFSATTDRQDIAALGHGSAGYTESYSWTGNAYNDASQDTKACTFTLTCKKCSTKVVNGASLTCTKTAHVDASCTATGSTTYQATGTYTAANSAYNYSATKTNVYTVAALGHIYSPGSWSWAGDGHSATCTRTCFRCTTNTTGHTSSKSVTLGNGITSFQGVAPTCNAMGMTHYTATATVEGTQYSATKDVLDIAALGHSYGAGAWSWADDGHTATCTRTCGRTGCYTNTPGHTSSKSVTLGNGITSAQQVAPTCITQGTTRYTATATVEGTQYNDTKDVVDIAALSHDYSQVVDEDYLVSAATCGSDAIYHEKCSRCDTHGAEWSATGTATGNHTFTNKTLTDDPVEDGLYAYACDNGCGTHTDDHIIKYFYGEGGHHLELTKDGEGNYSTSEDIIINESDFYYSPVDFSLPVDFTAASVTFNRYFVNDGGMYSFIVPFDIPAAQAAQLGKFYQYSKHEEGKVYFDDITKIDNADGIVRANTAYFFEPTKDIPSITVENPTFSTTGTMPDATNPSEPGLYGTYSQIDIPVGAYGYMMQHGVSTFVKADTGNLLRPFRAYLWLGSGASMAKARAFFGEEEANGIFDIDAESERVTPTYDLNGRRVNDGYKGIVIKNGKKIIVK